jgi:hypothetical protein
MIFSENRFPLFGIMLYPATRARYPSRAEIAVAVSITCGR